MCGVGPISPYDAWKLAYPSHYEDDEDYEPEGLNYPSNHERENAMSECEPKNAKGDLT